VRGEFNAQWDDRIDGEPIIYPSRTEALTKNAIGLNAIQFESTEIDTLNAQL
jgi:hypothetical protein